MLLEVSLSSDRALRRDPEPTFLLLVGFSSPCISKENRAGSPKMKPLRISSSLLPQHPPGSSPLLPLPQHTCSLLGFAFLCPPTTPHSSISHVACSSHTFPSKDSAIRLKFQQMDLTVQTITALEVSSSHIQQKASDQRQVGSTWPDTTLLKSLGPPIWIGNHLIWRYLLLSLKGDETTKIVININQYDRYRISESLPLWGLVPTSDQEPQRLGTLCWLLSGNGQHFAYGQL